MKLPGFNLITLLVMIFPVFANAQVDSIIVEKYYISDSKDATDTLGGALQENSVTYRIFVDLADGCKLKGIFGSEAHPLSFGSTMGFFNNQFLGKSYGYQINKNNLDNNTTALDTWVTLGFASNKHFGIPKSTDPDGSIVGGVNNDGGSAQIQGGLLVNEDPEAGIALTVADGLLLTDSSSASIYGFMAPSIDDTTIFNFPSDLNEYVSFNAQLVNNKGIAGADEQNAVLIAQLTTPGDFSFKINLVVIGPDGKEIKVVASDPETDEIRNRYLTYPLLPYCGCKDISYFEYSEEFDCHIQDSCKTIAIPGCMDPAACNYDPQANLNVPYNCCYPGRCNGRDIEVVCPFFKDNSMGMLLYPSPVHDQITISIVNPAKKDIQVVLFDAFGNTIYEESLKNCTDRFDHSVNLSSFSKGIYFVRLISADESIADIFTKN